jgi:Cu/Ag efflux protein CusF
MNTILKSAAATAAMAVLNLAHAGPAPANSSWDAAQNERSFNGNVIAINAADITISVKGVFFTRNFNTAADCKVSLDDKAVASLAELRPGQKVAIRYESADGVLIAKNIAQHDMAYTGHIAAIDPVARKLALKEGIMTRDLAIAPDCAVVLKGDQSGTCAALQVGDTVHVIYEPANGSPVARRIEQKSDSFVGTLQAVDATTRSVKVRGGIAERKFNLADSCPIVINGKLNGGLSDLRIGERVSLSYDNKDGVLIANRLSPMTGTIGMESAAPASSQTAQAGNQQPYNYNGY